MDYSFRVETHNSVSQSQTTDSTNHEMSLIKRIKSVVAESMGIKETDVAIKLPEDKTNLLEADISYICEGNIITEKLRFFFEKIRKRTKTEEPNSQLNIIEKVSHIITEKLKIFFEKNHERTKTEEPNSQLNVIEKTYQELITIEYDLLAVKQNGYALRYVEEQTPEICIEAVKKNGYALGYVKEQTPEICMEAVKQNGWVLQLVKEKTREICMEAVKQNGWALQYVKEQTSEICMAAVKQNGLAFQFVKEKTREICMEAVKKDGLALKFVKEQTPEICLAAVKQNGRAFQFVERKTPEFCIEIALEDTEFDRIVLGYMLKEIKELKAYEIERMLNETEKAFILERSLYDVYARYKKLKTNEESEKKKYSL